MFSKALNYSHYIKTSLKQYSYEETLRYIQGSKWKQWVKRTCDSDRVLDGEVAAHSSENKKHPVSLT